jgi:hypothetical protein
MEKSTVRPKKHTDFGKEREIQSNAKERNDFVPPKKKNCIISSFEILTPAKKEKNDIFFRQIIKITF